MATKYRRLLLLLLALSATSLLHLATAPSPLPASTTVATTPVPFPRVMASRRAMVAASCRLAPLALRRVDLVSLHLPSLQARVQGARVDWLLWCPVYKAASSNWFHRSDSPQLPCSVHPPPPWPLLQDKANL